MAVKKNRNQKTGNSRGSDVSDIFGTVDFPLKQHVSPHGRVTAVSMMKDEGPFVLEWVAHHLSLGFTDLVVYTNDCSDGTDNMLIRLEELGLAHHRRNDIPEGIRPQPSALKYAQVEPVVYNSDWVLVFDADEFLRIDYGDGTLDDMIGAAEKAGANGIVITWRIFGSGGVQDWSSAPVTEQYQYAAPPMWNKGWGVKTLFKFDPDYWKLGIHRPKIKNKHLETEFPHTVHWLNGSGLPMEDYFKFRGWRSIVRTVGHEWAQMNHYAIKSMDSYAIRKFRGNVNNKKDKYNADYWSLQDRNEVFDDSILRHAKRRKEIFDLLLTDEVLANLHLKAVEKVEDRLAEFKGTAAYDELVAGLKEASKVPITEVEAKPPKARDPAKIAAQMSEVERKLGERSKAERAKNKGKPNNSRVSELYVPGDIDLSETRALETFANHEILIPADSRVFSGSALQTITEGRFERNHARRLPGLIRPGDRYLEIGAGVGFLAAVLSRVCPNLQITAQEERAGLFTAAVLIWKDNNVRQSDTCTLVDVPMFHARDDENTASGLAGLLKQTKCTVLYINDPRLSDSMIETALKTQGPEGLPDRIFVGTRALAGACDRAGCSERLAEFGYAEPEDPPLNGALTVYRQENAL